MPEDRPLEGLFDENYEEQMAQFREALNQHIQNNILEPNDPRQEDQGFLSQLVDQTIEALDKADKNRPSDDIRSTKAFIQDKKTFEDMHRHMKAVSTLTLTQDSKAGKELGLAAKPLADAIAGLDPKKQKEFLKDLDEKFMALAKAKEKGTEEEVKSAKNDLNKLFEDTFGKEKGAELGKQLDAIDQQLNTFLAEMKNELKENLGSEKDNDIDLEIKHPEISKYANLFGILNSSITGGIAIPIQVYNGNGLGIQDFSPTVGTSPIDRINDVNDNQFGDSLGLNAKAAENFSKILDSNIDQIPQLLESLGVTNENTKKTAYESAISTSVPTRPKGPTDI